MADDIFFHKTLDNSQSCSDVSCYSSFQVESVLMNECQHKAETLDGVLSVFVLFSL